MKDYSDINILLDNSGSMESIKKDVIGSFNEFLNDQRNKNPTAYVSLVTFNNVPTLVKSANIKEFSDLNTSTYVTGGFTALIDSLAYIINTTGTRLAKMPEEDRPARVLVVIITDGEENSSTKYTLDKIKEMIKHQETKYSWDFIYLGANQDAISVGMSYGINANNSIDFNATGHGSQAVIRKMSDKVSAMNNDSQYRLFKSGGYFSQQDKEEVKNG